MAMTITILDVIAAAERGEQWAIAEVLTWHKAMQGSVGPIGPGRRRIEALAKLHQRAPL